MFIAKGAIKALTFMSFVRGIVSDDNSGSCINHGFDLIFEGHCNYENLLEKFTEFFDTPSNRPDGCDHSAKEELDLLLGGGNLPEKMKAICKASMDNFPSLDMEDVAQAGPDFLREYYNGNSIWNEEHETNYPKDDRDYPTNVLRTRKVNEKTIIGDAARVQNVYEGEAQFGVMDWPGHLTNFDLGTCATNAAMCCWPSDRQANDNNGNCDDPYDSKCEDSDPSDNTDLCYVDLEKGRLSTGFDGSGVMIFEGDDGNNQHNAEGPIHCHGFAWANDETDFTSTYKANNLFYVSMYDHMSQRGYVRNIQGAPMCGCTEQMPTATRSDCTQVDVEEQFQIYYDGTQWSGKLVKVFIDFNSCEGYDRKGNDDNNDLWSYMNRLYYEDKVTKEQLLELGKVLVGDQPKLCHEAIEEKYLQNGSTIGYNEDTQIWEKVIGKESLKMEAPFPSLSFDYVFSQSPDKIIMRVCISCPESHHFVFYKRLTPVPDDDESFDHLDYLAKYNRKHNNLFVYGVDFELYSTYEEALSGTNEWNCQDYKYDHYFPGGCAPDGSSADTDVGARFNPNGRKTDAAFYIQKIPGKSLDIETLGSFNIGYVGLPGTVRAVGNTLYISGAGHDIWGAKDAFNFYAEPRKSDLAMKVSITQFAYIQVWSKTGLMIRESLDPSAKFVALFMTGLNGLSMHWRSETDTDKTDQRTLYYNGPTDAAVMKLVREGNTFTSYYLDNTKEISTVVLGKAVGRTCEPEYADLTQQECVAARDSFGGTGNLNRGGWTHAPFGCFMNAPESATPGQIYYGYNRLGLNDGGFESVCKEKEAAPQSLSVNSVNTVTCKFSMDDRVMSVHYDGVDITDTVTGNLDYWNSPKSVEFVAAPDATLTVYGREFHHNNNNCYASGFLMECTASDGNSAWNGVTTSSLGWRTYGVDSPITDKSIISGVNAADDFTSSICTSTSGFYLEGANPTTRKIWAMGSSDFAAFAFNPDDTDLGEQWVFLHEINLDMPEDVYAGLAVTSHHTEYLAEATFKDYEVEQYTYPSASPSLSLAPTVVLPSRDVGSIGLTGSSSMTSDGRYVLRGSGRDIWDRDDGFHAMFYKHENNDFDVTAHIDSFDYGDENWAKGGIMARFFLCNKSPHVFIGIFGDNGFSMIWRECMDCNTQEEGREDNVKYTQGWVRIAKVGDEYSGYFKHNDDDEWNLVKTVTLGDRHEPDLNVGMVVSAHDVNKIATATFSDFIVE